MKNKICSVTTLKASLDQTISFVNYHLNIGIDHMFLFFDNPKDRAIEILKDYDKVTCFRCDKKHWSKYSKEKKIPIEKKQRINSREGLKHAIKKNYEWIAHIDSDELIYIRKNLKEFLKKIPEKVDYVRLVAMEVLPEKINYKNRFKEANLFKINIPKISRRYFNGHTAGKSITRISDKIDNLGIHVPEAKKGYELKRMFSARGRILHFDCSDFREWKTKYSDRAEGRVTFTEMGESKKKKMLEFSKVYAKNNEDELKRLYKKHYMMSKRWVKIFLLLQVLKRIKIDMKLFNPPGSF
jgi:hypothetical protein